MSDDRNFMFGYFFARRFAKPWKPGPRRHPKMPSRPWRIAALVCFATGFVATWAVFRDSNAVWLRALFGGVVAMAVGLYVVETLWERRLHAKSVPPPVIGRRR